MGKFYSFFISNKEMESMSIENLRRTKYLILLNLVATSMLSIIAIVNLALSTDILFAYLMLSAATLFLISFIFIRKHKYSIAGFISSLILIIGINIIIYTLPYLDRFEIYRSAFSILFCFLLITLIAYKRSHIIIASTIGFFSFITGTYIRVIIQKHDTVDAEFFSIFIPIALVLFLSSLVMYNINNIAKEIFSLAQNQTIELKQKYLDLQKIVATVEKNIMNLDEVKNAIKTNSMKLTKSAHDVTAASEEISSTMQELTISIGSIAKKGIEMKDKVESSILELENGIKYIRENTGSIDELSNMTTKIKNFTTTISDITEQTKLLSLNASIEAARAGEYGKGFAIVAKEIQKLADKSSSEATDISNTVSVASKLIEQTFEINKEIVFVFDRVSPDFMNLSRTFFEISETTQEQATGAEDVVNTLEDITKSAETVVEVAEIIEAIISKLEIVSNTLISTVKKYKLTK